MQPQPHPLPAEQHDAKKAGLKEEGGEDFVGQQWPGNAAREIRKIAPVGAELVGHDQARDHAHAEIDGKNLDPVKIELAVDRVAGFRSEEHTSELQSLMRLSFA